MTISRGDVCRGDDPLDKSVNRVALARELFCYRRCQAGAAMHQDGFDEITPGCEVPMHVLAGAIGLVSNLTDP